MRAVWHWLLERGIWSATLIIWGIAAVVYMIAMGILWVLLKGDFIR